MKREMKNEKSTILTLIGIGVMMLLSLTKIVPSSTVAGYSVFVGIAFFFIVEAAAKTKGDASGLRFHTIAADLRKPGAILWLLLPTICGLATLVIGNLIFDGSFSDHLLSRTDSMLSFDQLPFLIGQLILAAFGEEIAYRGFFLGKGSQLCPVWICMVVSSAVFAAGHIAVGSLGLVAYDVAAVFLDSLLYSVLYLKTKNCVISTFAHILANAVSIFVVLVFC